MKLVVVVVIVNKSKGQLRMRTLLQVGGTKEEWDRELGMDVWRDRKGLLIEMLRIKKS